MKIQSTPKQSIKIQDNHNVENPRRSKNQAFGSSVGTIVQQGLNFLDTNQAWGANFVDLTFMVAPRTAVDFTRGPDAGIETLRRESSGMFNHSLIGAYGMGAAYILAQSLNKDFGVKAHHLLVNDQTIDAFGKVWHDELKLNNNNPKKALNGFLNTVVGGFEGFNPKKNTASGWAKISDEATIKKIVDTLQVEIERPTENLTKKRANLINKIYEKKKAYVGAIIATDTGAEHSFKFKNAKSSLGEMIDSVYKLSKIFMKQDVVNSFATKDITENVFLKRLKNLNTKTSILGLGIAAAIGANIQPINMYLTKKKTGKSGFVGGGEADTTPSFRLMKIASASLVGAMVFRTIGKVDFFKNIQFKGFTPGLNQLKVVYGSTIMSRLLVARNKNELRESATKDSLGFLNLLVLGSLVSKLTALGFQKFAKLDNNTFLKSHAAEGKASRFTRFFDSKVITRNEVLFDALKKEGISAVTAAGKALNVNQMMCELKKISPSHPALKKVNLLNVSQLVGYIYSGVVLGYGIPKLNIAITKLFDKKNQQPKKDLVFTASNVAFLKNKVQNEPSFASFTR